MASEEYLEMLYEKITDDCDIIPDNKKINVISEIQHVIDNLSQKGLYNRIYFDIKMILFQNRYKTVDKEEFFNWITKSCLVEFVDTLKEEVR